MFTTLTAQLSTPTLLRLIEYLRTHSGSQDVSEASKRQRPRRRCAHRLRQGSRPKSRTSIPAGIYPNGASSATVWRTSRIELC